LIVLGFLKLVLERSEMDAFFLNIVFK